MCVTRADKGLYCPALKNLHFFIVVIHLHNYIKSVRVSMRVSVRGEETNQVDL
jgi:hypothetical protein